MGQREAPLAKGALVVERFGAGKLKILDDLVSTLNVEAEVHDIRLGPFQTAVLTRNSGLASKEFGCLLWNGRACSM